MNRMENVYCNALGIDIPSVEMAAQSRDANYFALLIVVLLEHGGPVTLDQAARRIAAAGVDNPENVLASLTRCRPARPPIYRNGDQYALDPYNDETSLWAFRLGLRPPKSSPLRAAEHLMNYDVIVGVDVRNILQALAFDPGARRLAELGPAQKTRKLNRRGRTLKITTEMIIRGSCGISHPFGDKAKTLAYLREGQETKFRRRLEADAKSLLALYQYGCLHHNVRLRWGFLDETLSAPWVHRDERSLYDLMRRSVELDVPLKIVVGSPPGWENPWSRARLARVRKEPGCWRDELLDEDGCPVYAPEIQAARLMETEERGQGR